MMSERDYAPLSTACVRALNDKLYDKRKAAAVEIEKMVKEFASLNNTTQIKRLLKVLGQDFANSQNAHTRKGGLIGLAAIAVALGKQECALYTKELVYPILACFTDSDLRVRYYACESLYNVVKVARGSVLIHFSDIFSALSRLAADPDQNVKNGSELLDRLMKDIVTESASFDLVAFVPVLRDMMYTKNTFTRQFVISWVSALYAVPDIDLIPFLPEILDGLFRILEDPTQEIKKMCDTALGEFLRSIKHDPSRVDFAAMINILITHAQATDEVLQVKILLKIRISQGRVWLVKTADVCKELLSNFQTASTASRTCSRCKHQWYCCPTTPSASPLLSPFKFMCFPVMSVFLLLLVYYHLRITSTGIVGTCVSVTAVDESSAKLRQSRDARGARPP